MHSVGRFITFFGCTRGPQGWILDPKGVAKGTRSGPKPPISLLSVNRSEVPTIGFPLGKLMIPWFEDDKRLRRTVRRPKKGHRDPLHRVEHERSTEIERCLASLVALNEPGAGIVHLVHRLLWF